MLALQFSGPTASQTTEIAFDLIVMRVWKIESKALRRRLWRALARDQSREGSSWRFQLRQLVEHHSDRAHFDRILDRQFSPREIVRWLESRVAVGRLSRSEANAAMACVLARTDRDGKWKSSVR
jgi:hypothetical protein